MRKGKACERAYVSFALFISDDSTTIRRVIIVYESVKFQLGPLSVSIGAELVLS